MKTAKPPLRAKPPALREQRDLSDPRLAAFLDGAETTKVPQVPESLTAPVAAVPPLAPVPTVSPAAPDFPWQAAAVRHDVTKLYNLRLPEAYLLKLRYIADHTPHSMQRFCLDTLLPAIDAKIAEVTDQTDQ